MSLSRRSQRTSGWRRTMPEAVHGASSRMASKGWPSHHAAGWRGVAGDDVGLQAQALQGVVDALAARRVDVQRRDVARRPAPAGAPSCRRARRRRRGCAAALVAPAAGPALAAATARRAAPRHPAPTPRRRRSRARRAPAGAAPAPRRTRPPASPRCPLAASASRYCAARGLARVHAQRHRRPGCCWPRRMCCQCCGWSCFSRSIHQRGWFQRATGSLSVARDQRVALAQEAAQAGVDEAGLALGRRCCAWPPPPPGPPA